MLRLITLLVIVSAVALGQPAATMQVGWGSSSSDGCGTISANTAGKRIAFPIPGRGKTLGTVAFEMSATATVDGTEAILDLVASTTTYGQPDTGTVIDSKNLGSGTLATGLAVRTWTGWTSTLANGTLYYVVLKNTNSVPATNYIGVCVDDSAGQWSGQGHLGTGTGHSYYNGSSWAASANGGAFWTWSDGETEGKAMYGGHTSTKLHTSAEVGNLFTMPPGVNLLVWGVAGRIQMVGTATGNLKAKIYDGTTLLASSNQVPPTGFSTSTTASISAALSSPVTLQGGKSYRVVWLNTAADSASNCYQVNGEIIVPSAMSAQALKPFLGTMQKTAWAPGTWSETSTRVISMYLLVKQFLPASAGFVTVQ